MSGKEIETGISAATGRVDVGDVADRGRTTPPKDAGEHVIFSSHATTEQFAAPEKHIDIMNA